MLTDILTSIICHAFETHAGKNQLRKEYEDRRGLLVQFRTHIDHSQEEGYRYADLLIFAGMNYVEVWARRRWTVAPLDPDADEDADLNYDEGSSEWEQLCYHDSCWRSDGVSDFIWQNRDDLQGLSNSEPWTVVTLSDIVKLGAPLQSCLRSDDERPE